MSVIEEKDMEQIRKYLKPGFGFLPIQPMLPEIMHKIREADDRRATREQCAAEIPGCEPMKPEPFWSR